MSILTRFILNAFITMHVAFVNIKILYIHEHELFFVQNEDWITRKIVNSLTYSLCNDALNSLSKFINVKNLIFPKMIK